MISRLDGNQITEDKACSGCIIRVIVVVVVAISHENDSLLIQENHRFKMNKWTQKDISSTLRIHNHKHAHSFTQSEREQKEEVIKW